MNIKNIVGHILLGISNRHSENASLKFNELTRYFQDLSAIGEEELKRCFDRIIQDTNMPKLFGTSGVRGVFDQNITLDPVHQFVNDNTISPKFSYFFGRAIGLIANENRFKDPVCVCMDPRESGLILSMALIRGINDEGIDVSFGGVAPTPIYTLNPHGMTVVVTASHNPVEYNGFKVFIQGRPLVIKDEHRLESYIRAFAELEQSKHSLRIVGKPGSVSMDVLAFARQHFKRLNQLPELEELRIKHKKKLELCFLPLDLAYGAAACCTDENDRLAQISPPIAIFLSLGIPVVGYGCVRDASKMNAKIGAAYAYGETSDMPNPGEIAKFALGLSDYGPPAQRIAFLPREFFNKNKKLYELLIHSPECAYLQKIHVDYPDYDTDIITIFLDHPQINRNISTEVESELMKRQPLPGLMVDGDADRILVTTAQLSKQETPFLTGDMMIRLFAELAPEGKYSEVVFTIESGISLEKGIQKSCNQLATAGKIVFEFRAVTVGDRSIIDYFLERGTGQLLGGEPSGHIIFAEDYENEIQIIDDPFITYLRLLNSISFKRFDLDNINNWLLKSTPDYYCARKPDARTEQGISLTEKRQLELWDCNRPNQLSLYARSFIPAYIKMFGKTYNRAFWDNTEMDVQLTEEWKRLLDGKLESSDWNRDLPIGIISFGRKEISEKVYVGLHLDRRLWAGPEVVQLRFTVNVERNKTIKIGEGIFRNSGTSPKNAGYHKLWPVHLGTGKTITDGQLRELLDDLASERASWTEQYIKKNLR